MTCVNRIQNVFSPTSVLKLTSNSLANLSEKKKIKTFERILLGSIKYSLNVSVLLFRLQFIFSLLSLRFTLFHHRSFYHVFFELYFFHHKVYKWHTHTHTNHSEHNTSAEKTSLTDAKQPSTVAKATNNNKKLCDRQRVKYMTNFGI